MRALTDALRLDLLGSGVRVSTVDPGMVSTEFSQVRFHGDRKRAEAVYRGMTPLTGEDVAASEKPSPFTSPAVDTERPS